MVKTRVFSYCEEWQFLDDSIFTKEKPIIYLSVTKQESASAQKVRATGLQKKGRFLTSQTYMEERVISKSLAGDCKAVLAVFALSEENEIRSICVGHKHRLYLFLSTVGGGKPRSNSNGRDIVVKRVMLLRAAISLLIKAGKNSFRSIKGYSLALV